MQFCLNCDTKLTITNNINNFLNNSTIPDDYYKNIINNALTKKLTSNDIKKSVLKDVIGSKEYK